MHYKIGEWQDGETAPKDGTVILAVIDNMGFLPSSKGMIMISIFHQNNFWKTANISGEGNIISYGFSNIKIVKWAIISRSESK